MKRLLTLLLCASPLLLLVSKWWSSTARGTTTTTGGGRDVNVLLWHWPFGVPLDLRGDVCLQRYNVPRCRLWHNRSAYSAADVVVFHGRDLALAQGQVPRHLPRPRGQRWVWMSLESPANSGNLHPFAGVFNLTMSYRRDADIIVPYGKVVPREAGPGGGEEEEEPLQRNKSIPVCWVVSNYQPGHRRSQVFSQLRDVVPVTVYGQWNNRILSIRDLLPTISGCYFYLAFENSESRDYITEKLWRNAYQSGAVPVVLGPPLEDYQAVAPRGSFIHVDEFASVADLGRRLRQLVEEEAAGGYAAFFRWRRDWRVKQYTDWRERLCSICSQYSSLPENKTYADLHAWVHAPHGRMETTR